MLHHAALQSEASLYSNSEWGIEHVLDSGIKLPPGTQTYQINVLDLHPTQLAVGMQQVQVQAMHGMASLTDQQHSTTVSHGGPTHKDALSSKQVCMPLPQPL